MDAGGPPGGSPPEATGYDPESVAAMREAYPEVFGEDARVLEIPDRIAAEKGTHEPGETLFVARVAETDGRLELADVYRVTDRGRAGRTDLYFVAKEWADATVPRDAVEVY